MSAGQGRAILERSGFHVVAHYGIRHALDNPRHLVPLSSPPAVAWYLNAAFLPRSRRGGIAATAAKALHRAGLGEALFPGIGFAARRAPQPDAKP